MVKSTANTVEEYLADLPEDRRKAIEAVREIVLKNLPKGYVECMQYGMIGYVVPFETLADTYNNQPLGYAALANQKNYMALYLNNVYGDKEAEAWFTNAYNATGKRLDMGKSCVRFKKLDDLPLDVIGQAIARTPVSELIERYKESRKQTKKGK